tara:strand:- start:1531 stop:2082 length:552 start_codon:yes stop_codon:yes gene_type:complete
MLFTGVASCQGKQANRGFTIWELMVVLVIVAILSAAAVPNLRSGMRREQLIAASLGIVNWLERARNQAVKDMETCQLSITDNDTGDASLAITSDSPGCSELTIFKINEQENTPADISLVLPDSPDSEFSFSPRGSVNRQLELELTIEGLPITRCIKVVAPVGLVRSGIKRDDACSYEQELKYE